MSTTPYLLDATWTDDAQGKKDYDGGIVSISTRYWPRGGSALVVTRTRTDVTIQDASARPAIPPSATSSLILHWEGYPGYLTLTSADFAGETFAEVAAQVERWAQQQMDLVVGLLRQAFPTAAWETGASPASEGTPLS
jgi:hypothetical protein